MSRTKKKKAKPRAADTDACASLQGDGEEKVRDAPSRASASADGSLDSNTSTGADVIAVEQRTSALWDLWMDRIQPVLKNIGVYALVILGAYWILAAWFSAWGDTWLGRAWWTFVGVVLIHAGAFGGIQWVHGLAQKYGLVKVK